MPQHDYSEQDLELAYVSVPQGAGGRESLIRTIVHDTKEYYRTGTKPPEYSSMGINR